MSIRSCFTVPLPPHKLIQIAGELVSVTASHSLEFGFHPTPITFHMLGVDSCGGLYEVDRMVNHTMTSNIGQIGARG